jgi:signal transduction histidine kinase
VSGRLITRVPWILFASFLALALTGTFLQELNGPGDRDYYLLFAFIVFAGFGAFIASRVPGNPLGWIFMTVASLVAIGFVGGEYAVYALRTNPGSLPAPEWAAWFGEWTWIPAIGLMTTFLFLLFPDGHLPSRRWRPVAWFAGALLGAAFVLGAFTDRRFHVGVPVENPAGFIPNPGGGPTPAEAPLLLWLFLVAIVLSVCSVFFRYRGAPREQRQQLKWFLYAGAFTALSFGLSDLLPDVFGNITFGLVLLALPAATAVAVLKYRLYDIDVVINKTVVYLVLAAFITAVYVLVVVAIPVLVFGAEGGFNPLPFAAAAIVALAFQPVRRWGSRLANRFVYGKRATPYEVLSQFSHRMGETYSAEDVLPRMARTLCEGTGAARTEVWLRVGHELRREAAWPDRGSDGESVLAVAGGDLPQILGAARTYPVEHQGELLGALAISMPRGETVTPANEKLVRDVASQAGLVLRNVRLIEELRASRQRLVAAQDQERRRLERNIHDGAQQQLVALSVKLRLAETMADRDPAKAKELIGDARGGTQEALDDLRDLARGIYPPLLADKGLAAALEAQARKSPLPVEVQPDRIGRYPQEAEAAAYFCVLEALQNVAKYAGASRAIVRLGHDDGVLQFSVTDDGGGFDPASTPRGSGLQNMADRLEALGGRLDVDSAPDGGTTVRGWIPVGGGAALP